MTVFGHVYVRFRCNSAGVRVAIIRGRAAAVGFAHRFTRRNRLPVSSWTIMWRNNC